MNLYISMILGVKHNSRLSSRYKTIAFCLPLVVNIDMFAGCYSSRTPHRRGTYGGSCVCTIIHAYITFKIK